MIRTLRQRLVPANTTTASDYTRHMESLHCRRADRDIYIYIQTHTHKGKEYKLVEGQRRPVPKLIKWASKFDRRKA